MPLWIRRLVRLPPISTFSTLTASQLHFPNPLVLSRLETLTESIMRVSRSRSLPTRPLPPSRPRTSEARNRGLLAERV